MLLLILGIPDMCEGKIVDRSPPRCVDIIGSGAMVE